MCLVQISLFKRQMEHFLEKVININRQFSVPNVKSLYKLIKQ